MRSGRLRVAVAALVSAGALLLPTSTVLAQEPGSTVVTRPHIIPRPNSGEEPTEAGDRGGALQLAVLGVVAVAVAGGVVHLVRQARRAQPSRMASQALTPERKPDR